MPDNPRGPGHPSDIPSSRSSGESSGTGASGPPSYTPNNTSLPAGSSGNFQTRNIIIGAVATIIASTIVYYLTHYVNNKKEDTPPSYAETKEATIGAWKRYVTIENIYHKNMQSLSKDNELKKNLENYKVELFKEMNRFAKDLEEINKDRDLDEVFHTMITRRLERENEARDIVTKFVEKIRSIDRGSDSEIEKQRKRMREVEITQDHSTILYERTATEIGDLTKTLTETYGTTFDPRDILMYAEYQKDLPGNKNDDPVSNDTTAYARNVNAKSLVGTWNNNGSIITLEENGTMSYTRGVGVAATGTWKIENDQLRLDEVSNSTKAKTSLFNLSNITARSFTMTLNIKPFYRYDLVRITEG